MTLTPDDEEFLAQLGPEVLAHHQKIQADNDWMQRNLDGMQARSRFLNALAVVLVIAFAIDAHNRLTREIPWISIACGVTFVVGAIASMVLCGLSMRGLKRMQQRVLDNKEKA